MLEAGVTSGATVMTTDELIRALVQDHAPADDPDRDPDVDPDGNGSSRPGEAIAVRTTCALLGCVPGR
jgi:hypothetical protein